MARTPGSAPTEPSVLRLAAAHREVLYELSRTFSRFLDLDRLLPVVMARAKEMLGFESCAILLHDPATDELYFPYVADVDVEVEKRFAAIRVPAGSGIAGSVLARGKVEFVADAASDPRWYRGVDRDTGMVTESLLCAPLRNDNGAVGVIQLRNHLGAPPSSDDLELFAAIADTIAIAIGNAQRYGKAVRTAEKLGVELAALHRQVLGDDRFRDIVGASPAMQNTFQLLDSAIASPITVLLRGETGTGKELLARAIHYNGPRRDRPFVAVNCSALSETLLESELFGHRRGSFTGADRDRRGMFEVADGGTIFLDEVGDTSPAMQAKLLRVLQEGEILPVGESEPRQVDVRVISATNMDLEAAIRAGDFRADLYYRLAVFPIVVPPLRERVEDIAPLAIHLLERATNKYSRRIPGFAPEVLRIFSAHQWPGNVRELQNEIERAAILAPEDAPIGSQHLSPRFAAPSAPAVDARAIDEFLPLREARSRFERDYVGRVLAAHGGNATQAAKTLGISRVMLQQKIREYGLRGTGTPAETT